ncbi:uncharacterized protein [Montipora foliosa]|uniref:uncharacterized protein isoform X3 n=1 Tax=Montipora foliosa TaxID=591990 RepID=UPI0035F1B862
MLMTSCGGYKIRSRMGNFHITVPAAKSSAVKMFRDMRKQRGSRHTYTDVHLEHSYIASCVRQQTKVGPDGDLLRAHKDIEGKSKIAVDFTGTDFHGSVAFQVGKSERFSANTFRCCLDNQQYYLCADEKEVFLLADTGEPNYDERVMFKIEKASRRYRTIKSVKTGMFLASNEFGRASMRLLSETPQDRQAWFELIELDMDVTCDSILTTTGDVTYKEETSEFECKIHDYHVPVDTQGAMIIGQGGV